MSNIKYCCHFLEWRIEEVGKKGFSILVDKMPNGSYYFVQQGRSHDKDNLSGHHVTFQIAIHYCFGCGKKLSELIDDNKQEIAQLYELHKDLLMG